MSTQAIYAEQTVSITEVRKNPSKYFTEQPVAVLSNNKTAGYMVSAETFEMLIKAVEAQQVPAEFRASFRPSAARLEAIAATGREVLETVSDDELGEFTE
ncbi:type I toxin-antitoxin system antitoxin YafN [Aliamphritea spongicola]|uniref:type I toxin-antitoxin system antitoxin YafN n=1 Tax=Aliamphritea spongicola TaxID=707589 RepID=UPI00196BB2E6|nr:type I toxin-antitoxin system antitoxin YafN [Aliamphritea spongicola]MBN3560996.1 type I toxin-antitoxin system antitoxin YafN [Aliamphritea spongicola]